MPRPYNWIRGEGTYRNQRWGLGSIFDTTYNPSPMGHMIGISGGDSAVLGYPVDPVSYDASAGGSDTVWQSTYPYGLIPPVAGGTLPFGPPGGSTQSLTNTIGSNLPIILVGLVIGIMLFRR